MGGLLRRIKVRAGAGGGGGRRERGGGAQGVWGWLCVCEARLGVRLV